MRQRSYVLPLVMLAAAASVIGQVAPTPTTPASPAAVRPRPSAYPTHVVDPVKVASGKALFGVNCAFCHGSDARGGEGGPNLIRSALVLEDQSGEKIAPTIQNGRVDRGMPRFDFDMTKISEIAEFLHSFKVGGYDASRMKPPSILVGSADQGRMYFEKTCSGCHSATGDMKGIGAKFSDPKVLQQTWIMPGGGGRFGQSTTLHVPPVTVEVKLESGKTTEGRLERIDDFLVSLTDSEGNRQTFRRDGDRPEVTIKDPLEPHRQLLPKYTDKEIHNLTAYLETLK